MTGSFCVETSANPGGALERLRRLPVPESAIRGAINLWQTIQRLPESQFRMLSGAVGVLSKIIHMVKQEANTLSQRLSQRMRILALEMLHPEF